MGIFLGYTVNNGNEKLGKSIKVLNVPAGVTCDCNAPCNKANICYAKKGSFNFKTVKDCYARNLQAFLDDPYQAEQDILSQLPYIGFVRWHASGDIVNEVYFDMVIDIANKLPNVKFMLYTKKYDLVNKYIDDNYFIPNNLIIIFSLWDGYPCNNKHNFPTSQVILHKGNIDPVKEGHMCNGSCDKCFKCWNLNKGDNVLFVQH